MAKKNDTLVIDGEKLLDRTPSSAEISIATMPKESAMQVIIDADWKVAEQKEAIKKTKDTLGDMIGQLPAQKIVDDAVAALAEAKKKLNQEIADDPEIQALFDKLAEQKPELTARETLLSGLLLLYSTHHKVRSIEMDDKEMHIIEIKAKVGKKLKEQLELPLF